MSSNYRFHAGTRGSRPRRLAYLTLYYALYTVLRWGDRHARALSILKRLGLSDAPATVTTPDGLTLELDLHTAFDPLYSIVGLKDYEAEPGFAPLPGWTVVDLGANLGVFATRAARLAGPEGRVVAVEPHPDNFRRLEANARRNALGTLSCVRAAAGDHEGEAELFVHERGINHSLVRGSGASVSVRLRTVDALAADLRLSRVDLLKIDIEGAVPAALRGAAGVIARFKPLIVVEKDDGAEFEGVGAFLEAAGYARTDRGPLLFARPRR